MTRTFILALFATVTAVAIASTASTASAQILNGLQVLYEFDTAGMPEANSASGNPGENGGVVQTNAESLAGSGSADFGTGESTARYMFVSDDDVAAASPGQRVEGASGAFTTSFWWKPTSSGSTQQSVWAAHDSLQRPLPTGVGQFPDIALSFYNAGTYANIMYDGVGLNTNAGSSDDVVSGTYDFFDGNWHHIAETIVVTDGATKTFSRFLDGQIASSASNSVVFSAWNMQTMVLGLQSDDYLGRPSVDLDGYLDDFAIWTRALSYQDISAIYNAGLQGDGIADIPEPSSMLLALLGLVGLTGYRWRRRVGIRS